MTSRPRTHHGTSLLLFLLIFRSESVGSPPSQVILFGDFPTIIPSTSVVALETSIIAPVIFTYRSCEYITPLPATLPFLYTDSSEASDSSDGSPSQDPYVAIVARWRSRSHHQEIHQRDHCIHLHILLDNLVRDVDPRDSYSSEASIEEDTKVDPIKTEVDMEFGISDRDDVRDHVEIDPRDVRDDTEEYESDTSAGGTVEVGIDPMSASILEEEIAEPAGEDSSDSFGTRDGIVRSLAGMPIDLDDVVRDFYHHMSEVRIDRIVRIETIQRWLEVDQLIARGERAGMIERIESLRLENLKVRAMLDIKRDRVNSLQLHMSLSQEEFRQVRRDRDDTRGRLRRLESYVERHLGFRP
ncbi:hypothetical protein Tco_0663401 [Tanacetum coccineum]